MHCKMIPSSDEKAVKYQSDRVILNTNRAALGLYEILWWYVSSDIEKAPVEAVSVSLYSHIP